MSALLDREESTQPVERMRPAATSRPRERHGVVVVGGGFAGLQAVRKLARAPVDVTLIDRRNFHLFQPLAYGSMVTQFAREVGAYVIGTGRAADRQTALDFGAQEFVDLQNDALEDVGAVDLVFDVIGGDIQKRSAGVIRAGGTLVTLVGPAEARPADGLAIDFVV